MVGVLIVNKCSSKRFTRDQSNAVDVIKELSSLVKHELNKKGIKLSEKLSFVKVIGNENQTQFHYSIDVNKELQENVTLALQSACQNIDVS